MPSPTLAELMAMADKPKSKRPKCPKGSSATGKGALVAHRSNGKPCYATKKSNAKPLVCPPPAVIDMMMANAGAGGNMGALKPKAKRGRPAKPKDPNAPAPKRGRKGYKLIDLNPPKKAAPKKKSPVDKMVEEMVAAQVVNEILNAPAPKKRGRKPMKCKKKSPVDKMVEEMVMEEAINQMMAPAPKKRGRPKKAAPKKKESPLEQVLNAIVTGPAKPKKGGRKGYKLKVLGK